MAPCTWSARWGGGARESQAEGERERVGETESARGRVGDRESQTQGERERWRVRKRECQTEGERGRARGLGRGSRRRNRHGGNPGANLKSISHRCYLREVAFRWELIERTVQLPLVCLQGSRPPRVPRPDETLTTPCSRENESQSKRERQERESVSSGRSHPGPFVGVSHSHFFSDVVNIWR